MPCLRRGNCKCCGASSCSKSGFAASHVLDACEPLKRAERMRHCSAEARFKTGPALVSASSLRKCFARDGSAHDLIALVQLRFVIVDEGRLARLVESIIERNSFYS